MSGSKEYSSRYPIGNRDEFYFTKLISESKFRWNFGQLPLQELKLKRAITAAPTSIFFMAQKLITTETKEEFLRTFDLKTFLSQNSQVSPQTFLLSGKGNENLFANLLADQLKVYKKATYKLPIHSQNFCWYTSKSYEQASSEASAKFKAFRFKASFVLDLSGGLGIDDWAFSAAGAKVISLDPDDELNQITIANNLKTGSYNIKRITSTAEDFLESFTEKCDLVYLDADRREAGNRVSLRSEGKPNFFQLEEKLHQIGKKILLKLSPLVDLNACETELAGLNSISVISINYEVKEILCLIEPGYKGAVQREFFELNEEGKAVFSLISNQINNSVTTPTTSNHLFFEARPGLIKCGLTEALALSLGLNPQNSNGIWYESRFLLANEYAFRQFHLIRKDFFSKKEFVKYLNSQEIKQANIKCRDFGIGPEEFKKQYQLKDGGADYFFLGKDKFGEKYWFHCKKINQDLA